MAGVLTAAEITSLFTPLGAGGTPNEGQARRAEVGQPVHQAFGVVIYPSAGGGRKKQQQQQRRRRQQQQQAAVKRQRMEAGGSGSRRVVRLSAGGAAEGRYHLWVAGPISGVRKVPVLHCLLLHGAICKSFAVSLKHSRCFPLQPRCSVAAQATSVQLATLCIHILESPSRVLKLLWA